MWLWCVDRICGTIFVRSLGLGFFGSRSNWGVYGDLKRQFSLFLVDIGRESANWYCCWREFFFCVLEP